MVYVNFSLPIVDKTSEALMSFFSEQVNKGEKEVYLLLSSPGGSVRSGVTLYNFIMSLPIKVIMHNIGMIDSIANVIFLAGQERYAVPHSSFLFHGVGMDIAERAHLEEKDLKERLLGLERDQQLIAEIIAENSKLTTEKIRGMFLEAKTLTPQQAKEISIIHDIKEAKIPAGQNIQTFTTELSTKRN